MTFDGFISYSHAADGRLAPAVQRGLHRLAKPWHRRRALWIFRDQTGLSVTPALWSSIQDALDGSEHFVLLASPEAARSPWVNREIDHWVSTKPADRILPVVTDGQWQWDTARGDFTPDSTAVPDALRGVFAEEPLFLDLRWARDDQHLTLQHSRFRDAIAQLAAPMHGISKDELEGEDVRQHRRTRRLRSAAVAALALLTVVASLAGALAVRNADRATASAFEARQQEQVAVQQRGTAEQATAEAQRQQANASEQQMKAQNAAAETKRQEKRSRSLQATAERAGAEARRRQDQARRAKADARRQQELAERQQALAQEQRALAEEQRRLAQQAARETTRQQIIAAKLQRLAEEAAAETERQKAFAKQYRIWAEQATAEALHQEAIAREQEKRAKQAAEDARLQRENAARQEKIAVSRRLINESKATIRDEPGPALKLGLAAHTVEPGGEASGELAGLVTSTRYAGVIGDVWYADYGADDILATTDSDFTASLWNVADRAHPVRLATLNDGAFIGDPAFSPDNRTLAVRNVDQDAADPDVVDLFDVSNLTRPVRLAAVPHPEVMTVTFSPDGHTLATVDRAGSWRLWDLTDSARPRQLSDERMDGAALTFSPDGRTVVTQDEPATIWDVADRAKPTRIGTLPGDWVGQVAFSPRRPLLATNDTNHRLVLWDLQDRARPRKLVTMNGSRVVLLTFSDDGSTIATSDMFDTTTLWDVADLSDPVRRADLPDDAGGAYSLALSPNGRTLATAGSTKTLTLRTVAGYGEPHTAGQATGENKEGKFATLTRDGRRMMTAHADGTATVWDLSPSGPKAGPDLRLQRRSLQTAAINPGGTLVASLPDDPRMNDVTLTDVSDPAGAVPLGNLQEAPIIGGPYGGELAFSPDRRTLAVAEVGVMLFDVSNPRRPVRIAYFRDDNEDVYITVSAIAFSPDGRTLAVASERTISLWNVSDPANPVHKATLKGHLDAVEALTFSPDGRLLAAGGHDNRASLWAVADDAPRRRLATLTGHGLHVHSVAFTPDGRTLATASTDGRTLLWDIARLAGPVRLATLHHTGYTAPWLLFHPDGHTLLTGTGRGPTRTRALIWDYSALNNLRADPAGHACAVAGGGFTMDEWAASVPEVPYRQTCPP